VFPRDLLLAVRCRVWRIVVVGDTTGQNSEGATVSEQRGRDG